MKSSKIFRILLLPIGLLLKLYELAVDGSRDIQNKLRFRGAIIDRNCRISPESQIQNRCHILENCIVINSTINAYSYVGRNSMIQNASIGSFCSIANDVLIGLGTHPTAYFSTSPLFYRVKNIFDIKLVEKDYEFAEYQPIIIGNDVWIGARAIVLDGIKIGDGAIVASNAVVTKDVPPYAIVGGVPAKIIRFRFESERIEKLFKIQWWRWPLSQIKKRISELTQI